MRYYIRQHNGHVSGPHDIEDVRTWIRQKKVRPDMEFSVDRVDWAWGYELTDLFPPERLRRRATRRAGH